MDINSAFTDILSCNPNIQEIILEGVTCTAAEVFDGLHLHKLTSFCVADCDLNGVILGFPWSASAFSDSLLQVDLSESSIVASEVFALLLTAQTFELWG